jgi:riboflavin biosynthesis pyrimidine reductase
MTTLAAMHHLQAQSDAEVTILNFASAKNPGSTLRLSLVHAMYPTKVAHLKQPI